MTASPTTIQVIGTVLFVLAVIHTFSTKIFERLAHSQPSHAGLWHLLGEVEVVFGFWAMLLIIAMFALIGESKTLEYVDSRNFTEPMFVFAIMVVAASRPILQIAAAAVRLIAQFLPLPGSVAFYFVALSFVPLLGSLITEPAAMTLAALILRDRLYAHGISTRLQYVTLGTLFVNVSIGGTLTSFAAPPVLMVAGTWGWDSWFMLSTFGWKAAVAVSVNAFIATLAFRAELARLRPGEVRAETDTPWPVAAVHVLCLFGIVLFSHHPPLCLGLMLFFMGFATAYRQYQDRLILREGLLVAFFLAGLIVLGGQQQWWLERVLSGMDATTVYFGATALTAITDNAALTYLGSLLPNPTEAFKYALVAGAVTGGGLTVIANAPNPAGFAILRGNFDDETIHPVGLLVAATLPTVVAILAFQLL